MYLVIEIQQSQDNQVSYLVTTHETLNEAESKWHNILSYAAVSGLPLHSATVLNLDGMSLMNRVYTNQINDLPM